MLFFKNPCRKRAIEAVRRLEERKMVMMISKLVMMVKTIMMLKMGLMMMMMMAVRFVQIYINVPGGLQGGTPDFK